MSEIQLPLSLSPLDVAALVWFILVWGGYNLVIDRVLGRHGGLNSQMNLIREVWMRRMFAREDRVGDAILLGQLIQSVSFFASATMLLVAALAGRAAHAQSHVAAGVDIVVAQGYEAGGHTGEIAGVHEGESPLQINAVDDKLRITSVRPPLAIHRDDVLVVIERALGPDSANHPERFHVSRMPCRR